MRLAVIMVWLAITLALLLPVVPKRRREVSADGHELVKDPVCGTYVVRGRAVERTDSGVRRYFCGRECARQFASRLRLHG
jgi:YHS domain-containing protein